MTNSSDSFSITRILFVCYGNTCRSPMAQAVMDDLIRKRKLESKFCIDSAGISEFFDFTIYEISFLGTILSDWYQNSCKFTGNWQEGQEINNLAQKILQINGVQILPHRARQITVEDFEKFNFIVGMDTYNIQALYRYQNVLNSDNQIILMGDYNSEGDRIIEDPFFDNQEEDFAKCFRQISVSCENLLKKLVEN